MFAAVTTYSSTSMKGFARTTVERAGHTALIAGAERLTYAQLDERADRLAHVLTGAGVEPGARLAVMLPNSIPFVVSMTASAKLGVAVVTLNWHLRPTRSRGSSTTRAPPRWCPTSGSDDRSRRWPASARCR
jgi:acyl-CoA synthetase (AMP-forming)/AMP-acid ligase II